MNSLYQKSFTLKNNKYFPRFSYSKLAKERLFVDMLNIWRAVRASLSEILLLKRTLKISFGAVKLQNNVVLGIACYFQVYQRLFP